MLNTEHLERGRKRGRERGRKRGRKKGRERGRKRGKVDEVEMCAHCMRILTSKSVERLTSQVNIGSGVEQLFPQTLRANLTLRWSMVFVKTCIK